MNWLERKIIYWWIRKGLKRLEGGDYMDAKSIFKSKTVWANVLAVILIIAQQIAGVSPANIDPQTQTIILSVVNVILRMVTKGPVVIK